MSLAGGDGWGGLQHRLGQSPWAPLGHTGCWSLLRVQDGGSGSVRTFIGHTPGRGLGWGLSSLVVGRMETLGESSAQGKYGVLGCPDGH